MFIKIHGIWRKRSKKYELTPETQQDKTGLKSKKSRLTGFFSRRSTTKAKVQKRISKEGIFRNFSNKFISKKRKVSKAKVNSPQEIYNQVLQSQNPLEIRILLKQFLLAISKNYPNTFTQEERDDNYKQFIDICSHYAFIQNKSAQDRILALKSINKLASDDLYATFEFAYMLVTPNIWLSDSSNIGYVDWQQLRVFLDAGSKTMELFIREECLGVTPDDLSDLDGAIKKLESYRQKQIKLQSQKHSRKRKLEIEKCNNEINRLKAKEQDNRSYLRSSTDVLRDIFKRQIVITEAILNEKMAAYISSKSSCDVEAVVNEIMKYSKPLIEATSVKADSDRKTEYPDDTKKPSKIEMELGVFRKIIEKSAESQIQRL